MIGKRHRLVKPDWGKALIKGKPNPKLFKEIEGQDSIEGVFEESDLHILNSEGYNIYFLPNHPSKPDIDKPFASGKDIDVYNYVFLDMDLKDKIYESKEHFLNTLLEFPLKPTMVIDSGNGIHAYWQINNLTRNDYIILQFMLIQKFKTDESVWTPLQLMRCPGFYNTKDPNNLKLSIILEDFSSNQSYEIMELAEHLPEITKENAKKMSKHVDKLEGRVEMKVDLDLDTTKMPEQIHKMKRVLALLEDPIGVKGDRSSADFEIACILKDDLGFDRKTALRTLCQTIKALSRTDGLDYANSIVSKVYEDDDVEEDKDASKFQIKSVKDRRGTSDQLKNLHLGKEVRGPAIFDCLGKPWRRKQVLGLVAGPSGGKTTVSLKILKDMAENNLADDEIYVFFSLEMTEAEVMERWFNLVGEDSPLSDKLFIVANEDDEGNPRDIGFQEVFWFTRNIEADIGKKVGAVVIDHMSILSSMIDTSKQPNFGAKGIEGRNNIRILDVKEKCKRMKELAKVLDVFLIAQSQTTKEKAAECDVPLPISAAYGAADFEWFCDFIMTCWQPLRRVENRTPLRILAFQYAKNRHKHKNDKIHVNQRCVTKYDMDTGDLVDLNPGDKLHFDEWDVIAREERKKEKDNKGTVEYHSVPSASLKRLAGK